jgi:hypothetical protein
MSFVFPEIFDIELFSTTSYDLNMTMSYGGTQKGAIAPYSLPEHRYFIMEPEIGNKKFYSVVEYNNKLFSNFTAYDKNYYKSIQGGETTIYAATEGNGLDGEVKTVISSSDGLYFGGLFDAYPFIIDSRYTGWGNIVKWDGIHWVTVANPLNDSVNTIIKKDNDVYIGGNFTEEGVDYGNTLSYFAKKSDGDWIAVSGGTNQAVNNALLINNNIYIVGSFTKTGPAVNNAPYIAKYNTSSSTWINMSGGLSGVANCIIADGNDLYIGGAFITGSSSLGGETTLNRIAKWDLDSKTWSSLDNGILNNEVKCLFYDSDDGKLYAGGSFTTVSNATSSLPIAYVAYFKDGKWNSLNENKILNGEVTSIAKKDGIIYLGGKFTGTTSGDYKYAHLAGYKNGDFFNIDKGLNGNVNYILATNNSLYIAGYYTATEFGQQVITTKDIFNPFTASNYSNYRLAPRPQYVFNNHLPSSTGSLHYGGMKLFDLSSESPLVPLASYKQYPEAIFVLNDGYTYETEQISGKKPFFNSYNEYYEDLKPHSQKYSIVPEFRIDNIMEYYVKQRNGDFSAFPTSSYLSLDSNVDSLEDINSSANLTNPIKTFVQDVNIENKETNLSIKVNGLKKLLPYNGFYPQQRIGQLADYFINSLIDVKEKYLSSDNIEYDTNLSNGTPRDQQILTLIQPLFAPGILMNTIKSSIAVDWPAFIGNYGQYSSSTPPSFYGNIFLNQGEEIPPIENYTSSYYLKGNASEKFDFRFPFESLLEFDTVIPQAFKTGNNNLYYLDPTYYSTDVVSGSDRSRLRYPSYNLFTGSLRQFIFKDNMYKLGMHNFLAEIPNFFLQNGLTNFTSAPIQTINAVSGTAYVLDIVLERDSTKYKEFVQHPLYESLKNNVDNYISGVYLPPSPDSLYGPPSKYFTDFSEIAVLPKYEMVKYSFANFELKYIETPAYTPYLPSYYYGKSIARLIFLPNESKYYTLEEVLNNTSQNTQYINTQLDDLFLTKAQYIAGTEVDDDVKQRLAYKERMNISSSINLFLKSEIKNTVIDAKTGIATEVADSTNPKYSWVIQTKFETPSINFANITDYNNLGMNFIGGYKGSYVEGIYSNLYKGLWTSYGEPVKAGEGIKMYLEYNWNINLASIPGSTSIKPLAGLIDFGGLASEERKTIGLLSNNKTVQEGIVVIPYISLNAPLSNEYAGTITPIVGENGVYTNTYAKDTPKYFRIDKAKISEVLKLPFDSSALSFEQIKKQVNSNNVDPNNSIIKTIKAMTEFVIPPHLNWVKNRSIEPFIMYVFPFSTQLDTEDLSDIWQGLMPKPAKKVELESIEINHNMSETEMFHGKKLPEGVKFKVFKVKQQANINYYKLTADTKDDANFKFTFGNSGEAKIPEYSFNYPYDYFSLVELVNIEAKITVSKNE